MQKSDTSRVPRESLRISSIERPGWEASLGRIPKVGEQIYCLGGPAQVVRVLGRTTDGSRLLELRCADRPQAFFAASSNILIRSDNGGEDGLLSPSESVGAV